MPRRARLVLPEVPQHVIQRGNNRQACFMGNEDYLYYLRCLREQAHGNRCRVHAYVLMGNHVHLLLSVDDGEALARMMKALGQIYTQYFNRSHLRSGTLWEGRYKSSQVLDEEYFLVCQRYIELNPLRAGMVRFPGHYRWSSYRGNAEGRPDSLLTPHSLYQRLGANPLARQASYRGLFAEELATDVLEQVRVAANGNRPLGVLDENPPHQTK
ncbi:transposase [Janthinobacterium sp. BJB412]|nr:transposase [Janthinobacterium sp. BJB412]